MQIKEFLFHFFTPRETNNYKAKSLHVDFLSFYLVGALLLAFAVKGSGPLFHNVLGFATDITIDKLYVLTNEERQKNSLPPLKYNQTLSVAAQKKATDMLAKNYWSHFAPDGTSPWDFILNSGYQYEYAGENLAKNFLFSRGVVDAWMNSPTHKDNMLKKDYTEVGYAIVNGMLNGEETTLVVQMFATPLQTPSLTNPSVPQNEAPVQLSKTTSPGTEIVLGKDTVKPKVNILPFSLNASYLFMFFFAVALIADFYIASRLHIVKINSKNIAHLIFLGFILLSVIFVIKHGAIL